MTKDNVIEFKKPEPFTDDPLTDVLRTGARTLLTEALEAEIEGFLSQYRDLRDHQDRQRVVRNGYLPERNIQTGIGQVAVKVPRARDRQPDHGSGPIRFTSCLLPPYLRKTKSMEERQCLLVIIGATGDGKKELLALDSGFRESELSWTELLIDLKHRGLSSAPELAIGDGALGFWKALTKVYHTTRWQRCWVHKTANVLNQLPKSMQAKAKEKLHQIWMAPDTAEAQRHFDDFISIYEAKYPKAAECLKKDRDVLLTFYDFPAEHWRHIRTTNPIESTFSTVRLRTAKVRSCFSSKTVVTMACKLCQCAQKRWQRLYGYRKLGKVIQGVKFVNGIEEMRNAA